MMRQAALMKMTARTRRQRSRRQAAARARIELLHDCQYLKIIQELYTNSNSPGAIAMVVSGGCCLFDVYFQSRVPVNSCNFARARILPPITAYPPAPHPATPHHDRSQRENVKIVTPLVPPRKHRTTRDVKLRRRKSSLLNLETSP